MEMDAGGSGELGDEMLDRSESTFPVETVNESEPGISVSLTSFAYTHDGLAQVARFSTMPVFPDTSFLPLTRVAA